MLLVALGYHGDEKENVYTDTDDPLTMRRTFNFPQFGKQLRLCGDEACHDSHFSTSDHAIRYRLSVRYVSECPNVTAG